MPPGADAYAALVERFRDVHGVAEGKALHAPGLTVEKKIFAMLMDDALVVKLPRERVAALIEDGTGAPFGTSPTRIMREWVTISAASVDAWPALADEALAFVRPPSS